MKIVPVVSKPPAASHSIDTDNMSDINITARNSLPAAMVIVLVIFIFAAANLGTTPKAPLEGTEEYTALVMSGMTVALLGALLLVIIVLMCVAFAGVKVGKDNRYLAVAGGRYLPMY